MEQILTGYESSGIPESRVSIVKICEFSCYLKLSKGSRRNRRSIAAGEGINQFPLTLGAFIYTHLVAGAVHHQQIIPGIVRGNHDTSIEEFVPGAVRIYPASGARISDVGFIHGHTWPSAEVMACKTLVMGHEHPTVLFKDGVGAQTSEPCWVRGNFAKTSDEKYEKLPENFIVVPAFNRLLGGSPVNVIGSALLGPILNSDLPDLDNAHLYLLDGLDLGRRCDLMVKSNRFKKWNDDENSPRHNSL